LMMILRVMCLSCWEKLQSTINKSHLFESFRIYILNF
jgi:hypothetical protein